MKHHSKELLIQNPMDANRFTVYPNIDSYNNRSEYPKYVFKHAIDAKALIPVMIHRKELQVLRK